MIEVLNRQKVIEVDVGNFAEFAAEAVGAIGETGNRKPVIAFVDDAEMKRLNSDFRGKETTTDVLSFVYNDAEFEQDESLGDIVISTERAGAQAIEHQLTLDLEIKQLILHGILHLCGFDHETDDGEMNRREIELRAELGIV